MKDGVSVEPLCWVHQLQSKQAGPHVNMMQPTVSHRSDGWSYQGLHPPQPVQTALTALNGDWLLLAGPD